MEIENRNIVGSRQELMNVVTDNVQALSNPKELIHRHISADNDTVNMINEDMLKKIRLKNEFISQPTNLKLRSQWILMRSIMELKL